MSVPASCHGPVLAACAYPAVISTECAASKLIGQGASRRRQRSRLSWPRTRSIAGMRLTSSTIISAR